MARFVYYARDPAGRPVRAATEAESVAELMARLKERNLTVVSAREVRSRESSRGVRNVSTIRGTEISFFFRQLATMVGAGVSLTDALRELAVQTGNQSLRGLITGIRVEIENGINFSQALARYPHYFPPLVTAMVQSGEEGGRISEVLEQISVYLEDKLALQREVKTASTYPVFIGVFFLFSLAFITFFLIPKFEEIFKGFRVALPPLTRFVVGSSHFLLKNLPFVILFLVAAGLILYRYGRTRPGRRLFDILKVRLPVIGEIFHMVSISYFCQTFAVLLSSGVSVIRCLEIVGKVAGNSIIEESSEAVRLGVERGGNLSSEMRLHPIFPALLVRMIAVGEQTGSLGEMFIRVNKFYRDEAMLKTRVLTAVIEPVMLLGLGVIVGVVVIALYLPIFKMTGSVGV